MIDLKKVLDKATIAGNLYSGGTYSINSVRVTFKEGVKLPRGDYIFFKDPDDGMPIVYQVAYPYWYKPSFDFEESLIVTGTPVKEEHRRRYRCKAILLGKVGEDGEISPPLVPLPPLADAYRCPPELVELVTQPQTEWRIRMGKNPETGNPVDVDLASLVRQGLLITGAQGTGKTTGLLTMIARAVNANPPLRFLVLDWSGEYRGLIDEESLSGKVSIITWEGFYAEKMIREKDVIIDTIVDNTSLQKGWWATRLVEAAVKGCVAENKEPNADNLVEILMEIEHPKKKGEEAELDRDLAIKAVKSCEERLKFPRLPDRDLIDLTRERNVVVVDFSESEVAPDDFDLKKDVAAYVAEKIWEKARDDKSYGCVIVSDEGHRICPERGYGETDKIWIRLATEGGRNSCPLWLVARRLSLVTKSVTTELQQNIVCFNVEDIDRRRLWEDIGETFAGLLGNLAPGEAMVKSTGFRIIGQTIHVDFDQLVEPASARYPAKGRFESMARSQSDLDKFIHD